MIRPTSVIDLPPNGELQLYQDIFKLTELNKLEVFLESIEWEDYLGMRMIKWYGPYDYEYPGAKHTKSEVPELLLNTASDITNKLSKSDVPKGFDSVLLNYYRDGKDFAEFHADDENVLESGYPIATLNLGTTRNILFRKAPIGDRGKTISVPLVHGSVLVTLGDVHKHWWHSVPQEPLVKEARYSLTFRKGQYKK